MVQYVLLYFGKFPIRVLGILLSDLRYVYFTIYILAHEKSSLAPNGPSLAFKLGDEEGFSWIGECELTADQMLGAASSERKEDKRKQAKDLILSMLKGGRRVLSSEIDKAALDKGISSRTVRDAKAD